MFGAQMDSGGGVEGVVRLDSRVQRVVECVEMDCWRNRAGNTVGCPNVVVDSVAEFPPLAEKDLLPPLGVEEDIEGACLDSLECCIKVGLWILREAILKNSQGLGSVEFREKRVRKRSKGSVQLGS